MSRLVSWTSTEPSEPVAGAPLLPQQPIDERVEVDSVEWLFGPDWPGVRMVARWAAGAVDLTDAAGAPAEDPGFADALARALTVASATLDGVWTDRGSVDDAGVAHPAFVLVDVLELDGESILDVPFQERRRLLESVVRDRDAVRIAPVVKQPLESWLAGWREAGFTHYLARHQNARYHPGRQSDDWLRIPLAAPSAHGFGQRFVGSRDRRRRIRD